MRRIAEMLATDKSMPLCAGVNDVTEQSWRVYHGHIKERIKSGEITVVAADEIAEFYASHESQEWNWDTFVPCAPPWNESFIEWRYPKNWVLRPGELAPEIESMLGVYSLSIDCHGKPDGTALKLIRAFANDRTGEFESNERMIDLCSRARWLVMVNFFIRWFGPGGGLIHSFPFRVIVFLDNDGKPYGDVMLGINRVEESLDIRQHLHVAFLTFAFANCKNVQIEERQPTDEERKWHRRQRSKPIIYKTLRIGGMRKILETEGGLAENGPGKALHICRGHFARYTADAPLFGKYTGQFWHPQHMRGKKENGEVVKRYEVVSK